MAILEQTWLNKSQDGAIPINADNLNAIVDAINTVEDRLATVETKTQHITSDDSSTIIASELYLDSDKTKDVVYDIDE